MRKCTLDGKVLLTLGIPARSAPYQSGEPLTAAPTSRCRRKRIYVSDGTATRGCTNIPQAAFSWGEPGSDPGQFNIAQHLRRDKDGYLYVADRKNHRVQGLDGNGKFEAQWHNMHRPCAPMDRGPNPLATWASSAPACRSTKYPQFGPAPEKTLSHDGKLLARLGSAPARRRDSSSLPRPGARFARRYLRRRGFVDDRGSALPPREMRCLQKL